MARQIGRLTALAVSRAKEPGMYADGGGLYLQITNSGAKSWVYRFMLRGKAREMGLGPLHSVQLAGARVEAGECRRLRMAGIDPIEARRGQRAQAHVEAAKAVTFKEAADSYIAAHAAGWRNAKHASQWRATLESYVCPTIGGLPVQAVDTALVLKILEPIWSTKPETASRVRGRIEVVLDAAKARGQRSGENPARWRGHLDNLLPARAKIRRVVHHAALPYVDLPEFMQALRAQEGTAARALEFLILTAARTGEVTGARAAEIHTGNAVWTVPAERIKTGKEHRVPLSPRALAIAEASMNARDGDYVFPGGKRRRPLSNAAFLALLKRMGRDDITAHGFRSTFRDWTAERTSYPGEVAEMALAHAVGDKVEAAYRRGDLFEKRRRLMAEWAKFCSTPKAAGKVVSIGSQAQLSA